MSVKRILARALGLSEDASDDAIAGALAHEVVTRQQLADGQGKPQKPAMGFLDGVARLTELGIPYGDACSLASREAPALYFEHVRQSELN